MPKSPQKPICIQGIKNGVCFDTLPLNIVGDKKISREISALVYNFACELYNCHSNVSKTHDSEPNLFVIILNGNQIV